MSLTMTPGVDGYEVTMDGATLVWVAVPASATAAGARGNLAADASFLYVCIAANTWVRVGVATW